MVLERKIIRIRFSTEHDWNIMALSVTLNQAAEARRPLIVHGSRSRLLCRKNGFAVVIHVTSVISSPDPAGVCAATDADQNVIVTQTGGRPTKNSDLLPFPEDFLMRLGLIELSLYS